MCWWCLLVFVAYLLELLSVCLVVICWSASVYGWFVIACLAVFSLIFFCVGGLLFDFACLSGLGCLVCAFFIKTGLVFGFLFCVFLYWYFPLMGVLRLVWWVLLFAWGLVFGFVCIGGVRLVLVVLICASGWLVWSCAAFCWCLVSCFSFGGRFVWCLLFLVVLCLDWSGLGFCSLLVLGVAV